MSLRYQEARKLSLAPGSHPRGVPFLSAASGLVRVGDRFYVIADDELHLGVFTVGDAAPLALGAANGVPFAFTDGAALGDGSWVFSAVAEDRDDSYDDGPCVAAAIGICGSDDVLGSFKRLLPTRKIEGIEASVSGSTALLNLVTDGDDPARAAERGTKRIALPESGPPR